jgi:uncharacterized protein (TIGR02453 family)
MPLFSKKTFTFLKELKSNNDRDWFAENKARYESDVLQPSLEFIEQMNLLAEPKRVGGSLMRIYRDTRFSKDKTPYKTNVGIHFRHSSGGSDVHAPGLYVHLEPGACFLAAGIWLPPTEPLQQIRQAIMEEPKLWRQATQNKAFGTSFRLDGDSLKTAPRGIDPNHSEIADLKRKSFAGIAACKESVFCKDDFLDFAMSEFSKTKPLMKFLCDALGQPY